MEEVKKDIFEEFVGFMEHDTRGVQILSYGLASVGLLTAIYKIKPFTKFIKPLEIPNHFLKNKVQLEGVVMHVEPSKFPHLLVNHKPLLPVSLLRSKKYLPVTVAGVKATGNGISWLQSVVKGERIKFIPIAKEKDFLSCIITVPQNKEPIQVGQELVRLGFGTVHEIQPYLADDKEIKAYIASLRQAQRWAERKRNGFWHFEKEPTLSWKIKNNVGESVKSKLPEFVTKYFIKL